jgi:A/G-specific adenine glycosylase
MQEPLSSLLLEWYAKNARVLPWRGHPDPYAVWVSEIMLQQTRVETVIPYFYRWMERFPSVGVLARASEQEVLAVWEGLGYYGRARNMHRAAKMMEADYGGQIPSHPASLQRLPGIGRSTAAAIASISFGVEVAALDGNIRRVLARVFNVIDPLNTAKSEALLWELAYGHLPAGQAGDYNQALMDLGATVCTPRQPRCDVCPLQELCQAYVLGVQEERPVRAVRPALPHYTVTAAVIHCSDPQNGRPIGSPNGLVLIARRPSHGLLGGLWEFPGGKLQPGEHLAGCLQREIREELGVEIAVGELLGVYRHAYTHFRVTLHAFECALAGGAPQPIQASELRWVTPSELVNYPMGKLDRQIAIKIQKMSAASLIENREI